MNDTICCQCLILQGLQYSEFEEFLSPVQVNFLDRLDEPRMKKPEAALSQLGNFHHRLWLLFSLDASLLNYFSVNR